MRTENRDSIQETEDQALRDIRLLKIAVGLDLGATLLCSALGVAEFSQGRHNSATISILVATSAITFGGINYVDTLRVQARLQAATTARLLRETLGR